MFGLTRNGWAAVIEVGTAGIGMCVGGMPGALIIGGAGAAIAEGVRGGDASDMLEAGLIGGGTAALFGGVFGGVRGAVRLARPSTYRFLPRELANSVRTLRRRFWGQGGGGQTAQGINSNYHRVNIFTWRNARANSVLPHLYSLGVPGAMAGAGVATWWLGSRESGPRNGLGQGEIPTVQIFPTQREQPAGMEPMYMPDQQSPLFPHAYDFLPVVGDVCQQQADTFAGYYRVLGPTGVPSAVPPPPAPPPSPPSAGATPPPGSTAPTPPLPPLLLGTKLTPTKPSGFHESENNPTPYPALIKTLQSAADALQQTTGAVLAIVGRTAKDIDNCRGALDKATADIINEGARAFPDPMTEDEHILEYTGLAAAQAGQQMDVTLTQMQAQQAAINGNTDQAAAIAKALREAGHGQGVSTPPVPQVSPQPPTVPKVEGSSLKDLLSDVPAVPSSNADNNGSPAIDRLADALKTPSVPSAQSSPLDALKSMPFANGGSPFGQLPGGLNGLQSPDSLRVPDVSRSGLTDVPPRVSPLAPPPKASAAAAPAAGTPAAGTPAATTNAGAPAHATTTSAERAAAAPPTRVADADGGVWYEFKPSGRKQKVSVLVAQALDAAIGNKDGTNAQLAYQNTPAKWSNPKEMAPVGPDEAITGCVVTWESASQPDHSAPGKDVPGNGVPGKGVSAQVTAATSAILVVFRVADGNTENVTADSLEVIVNGELVPYTDDLAGTRGFGDFGGFGRPRGVERLAGAPHDAAPASTGPAEPGTLSTLISAGTVTSG
ncbi:hypothetical protein [Nocardia colli]|uniref:hypothetical protein n=1 Tax=Nocardia colli TaxID=2545717 RepID=UPI0035D881BD